MCNWIIETVKPSAVIILYNSGQKLIVLSDMLCPSRWFNISMIISQRAAADVLLHITVLYSMMALLNELVFVME